MSVYILKKIYNSLTFKNMQLNTVDVIFIIERNYIHVTISEVSQYTNE